MALNFQQPNFDPNEGKKKSRQYLREAIQGIPSLMFQYEALKRQREADKNDYELGKFNAETNRMNASKGVSGKNEILFDLDDKGRAIDVMTGQPITQREPGVDYTQVRNDALDKLRVLENLDLRRIPPLSATENKEISDMDASRIELRKLIGKAKETGFGTGNPLVERARGAIWNPFDPNSQKFKQYIAQTKQIIGKALEGGVLRKEDEIKYESIIPRIGDTDEIILGKADQLDKMISDRQQLRIENFKKSFRNVPNAITLDPLVGGSQTPQPGPAATAVSPGAKIIVSNGQETLEIDAADFEEARKEGFEVVR